MEVWKPIVSYPNYYISNFGNVKNKNGLILKPIKDYWGYLRVNLYNPCAKMFKIHHLVYSHFSNDIDFKLIDHIDRNKENNNIINLRKATKSLNALNTNKKQNTTSKMRCCYFDKKNDKYIVRIRIGETKIYIGSFSNELYAGLAYNKYIIENNLINGFRKLNNIYQYDIHFYFEKKNKLNSNLQFSKAKPTAYN